jgi:hypothetical protein
MTPQSIAYSESSINGVRSGVVRTLAAALIALLLVGIQDPAAAQAPVARLEPRAQRIISLDTVLLETIRIEGQIQGWTLRKLCIDGQAYWVGFSETNPTGISPAFKDGKAEQCSHRAK